MYYKYQPAATGRNAPLTRAAPVAQFDQCPDPACQRRPYAHRVSGMARISVKATYLLDAETVRLLERTARRWSVSKAEALRRAIRAAAIGEVPDEGESVLNRLQEAAGLDSAGAKAWTRRVRDERRKSATRPARRN